METNEPIVIDSDEEAEVGLHTSFFSMVRVKREREEEEGEEDSGPPCKRRRTEPPPHTPPAAPGAATPLGEKKRVRQTARKKVIAAPAATPSSASPRTPGSALVTGKGSPFPAPGGGGPASFPRGGSAAAEPRSPAPQIPVGTRVRTHISLRGQKSQHLHTGTVTGPAEEGPLGENKGHSMVEVDSHGYKFCTAVPAAWIVKVLGRGRPSPGPASAAARKEVKKEPTDSVPQSSKPATPNSSAPKGGLASATRSRTGQTTPRAAAPALAASLTASPSPRASEARVKEEPREEGGSQSLGIGGRKKTNAQLALEALQGEWENGVGWKLRVSKTLVSVNGKPCGPAVIDEDGTVRWGEWAGTWLKDGTLQFLSPLSGTKIEWRRPKAN